MPFIVMTASAHMPSSCKGRYRRVAVVEVEEGTKPAFIGERARGVIRIVETWERLNVGTTERGAYQKAVAEAETLAAKLNERR